MRKPALYREIDPPDEPLARRHHPVETLWTYRAVRDETSLILPDGRADVILRCRIQDDGACDGILPVLTGPATRPQVVPILAGDGFVGIRLRPGHAGMGGPADELRDRRFVGEDAILRIPSLAAVPKRTTDIRELADALLHASWQSLAPEPPAHVEAALDRLHLSGGRLRTAALTSALGIGARRMHRAFTRHVGMPPQSYAGVIRFQRAARLAARGLTPSQAAAECGYADQPHMTRAFRRYGGFTPNRMPDATLARMPF